MKSIGKYLVSSVNIVHVVIGKPESLDVLYIKKTVRGIQKNAFSGT